LTCTYLAKRLRELSSTKTGSYPHEFLCRTNCSACADYQLCLLEFISKCNVELSPMFIYIHILSYLIILSCSYCCFWHKRGLEGVGRCSSFFFLISHPILFFAALNNNKQLFVIHSYSKFQHLISYFLFRSR
jgi:hypothetical protein